MGQKNTIDEQVQRFHNEIVEVIKKYQFRDRNQMTCCGISVSQCYVLESLHRHGSLTMQRLAEKLHLKISTVTRIVEQLVKKGYATREEGENDRRFRLIKLTPDGLAVFHEAWQNVFESEKMILEQFPPESRELLIRFLRELSQAVTGWQSCCCR